MYVNNHTRYMRGDCVMVNNFCQNYAHARIFKSQGVYFSLSQYPVTATLKQIHLSHRPCQKPAPISASSKLPMITKNNSWSWQSGCI